MKDDLISRQAAIHLAPGLIVPNEYKYSIYNQAINNYCVEIMQLPSAQSEQQWIPCSERLPEENDYKSCIECLDGAVWYFTENGTMGLGYYYKSTKEWSTTDDLKTDGKVIAWMPLPKPYRESKE